MKLVLLKRVKVLIVVFLTLVAFLPLAVAQSTPPVPPPGTVNEQIDYLVGVTCTATSEGSVPDVHEYRALAELFLRTNGAAWTDNDNWLTTCVGKYFGDWIGITVENGDVIAIELPSNNLSGSLASSLARLRRLQVLRLSGNAISGELPDSLSTLPELKVIDLANNAISGSLSRAWFAAPLLRELTLSGNHLTGRFPDPAPSSLHLSCLQLAHNELSGDLSQTDWLLPALDTLDLAYNRFTGAIPLNLKKQQELSCLKLNRNRFRHCPDFSLFSALQELDISANGLDFGDLEPLFTGADSPRSPIPAGPPHFIYDNQTIANAPVRRVQSVDEPLRLVLSMGGEHNSYRWQKRGTTGWSDISGATTDQLLIPHPTLADAGLYRCLITNQWATLVELSSPETTVELRASTRILVSSTVDATENDNWNWTLQRTFDGSGINAVSSVVIGESKQYTDGLGREIQTQSRNLTANEILATQRIYGSAGHAVLSTLPAPTVNQSFNFVEAFVRPVGLARDYAPVDFEVSPLAKPVRLDTAVLTTVGRYYSHLNSQEPNTPATGYPFALSETIDGPLGNVRRMMGPGEATCLGSTHETRGGVVPVLDELDAYAHKRWEAFDLERVANVLFTEPTTLPEESYKLQANKSVVISADGNETIIFADKDGLTLGSCRTLPWTSSTPPDGYRNINQSFVVSAVGNPSQPKFVDIHVPVGGAWLAIREDGCSSASTAGGGSECKIINLLTNNVQQVVAGACPGNQFPATPTTLFREQGFYRVIALTGSPILVSYNVRYGEFTYTYYDAAGRPFASVAPKGESLYTSTHVAGQNDLPFVTYNTFSSTGQLLRSYDTDANQTNFVYRADGVLRFSRNAEQAKVKTENGNSFTEFSYSNYDSLGRVVESGVYRTNGTSGQVKFESRLTQTGNPATNSVLHSNVLESRTRDGGLSAFCPSCRRQVNSVWYDYPRDAELANLSLPTVRKQRFVVGAVAKTATEDFSTWYSYDDQGRLTWLVQKGPAGVKTVDYQYDVSGNVLEVAYQKNQPDAFYHYYEYDPDQRLRAVYASPDGINRTQLAHYDYYLHGPLKRVELADRLQGVDYRYTINGWLKSLNEVNVGAAYDPGHDQPDLNGIENDLFSLRLDYFAGDYRSAARSASGLPLSPDYAGLAVRADRHDGTIRSSVWHTAASSKLHGFAYDYDPQGQFTNSVYGEQQPAPARVFAEPVANVRTYAEHGIKYDPNGNIMSLERTDGMGAFTAKYDYQYEPINNRLVSLRTRPPGTDTPLQIIGSYDYNEIGETIHQFLDGEHRYLTYDATGKVTGVYSDAAHNHPIVTYTYDDRGFRATQTVPREVPIEAEIPDPGDTPKREDEGPVVRQTQSVNYTTHYVRDAAGNVLSTYEQIGNDGPLQQAEVPLYAASRVGTRLRLTETEEQPDKLDGNFDQRYELLDHLGSARVVFHKPLVATVSTGLEAAKAAEEEKIFDKLPECRSEQPALAYNGNYVALLTPNQLHGPKTQLAVQPGDSVLFSAMTFVPDPGAVQRPAVKLLLGTTAVTAASAVLNTKAGPTTALSGSAHETAATSGSALGQVLRRLSVGLGFPIGAGHSTSAVETAGSPNPIVGANAGLYYKFVPADNSAETTEYQFVPQSALSGWVRVELPARFDKAGTVYLEVQSNDVQRPVLFDDVTVRHRGGLIVQEQHQYPYGSPITGLSYTVGSRRYRHGYQGQYAEADTATDWNSFELRLYDAKRARWNVPDPEGQFDSPYVAMGNNPVIRVDPDGAFSPTGALVGGVVGAALGYAIDKRMGGDGFKGLAIGGGLGVLVGGYLGDLGDHKSGDGKPQDKASWWDETRANGPFKEGRVVDNGCIKTYISGDRMIGSPDEIYQTTYQALTPAPMTINMGSSIKRHLNYVRASATPTRGSIQVYFGDKRVANTGLNNINRSTSFIGYSGGDVAVGFVPQGVAAVPVRLAAVAPAVPPAGGVNLGQAVVPGFMRRVVVQIMVNKGVKRRDLSRGNWARVR